VESGRNWPKLHILLPCSDCPLIVWSVDLYGGSTDRVCTDTSNFSPPLMRIMAKISMDRVGNTIQPSPTSFPTPKQKKKSCSFFTFSY
jgi:hypothetical protein